MASEPYEKMKEVVQGMLSQHFKPEFINRIDETVVFHPLAKEHIHDICKIQIQDLVKRLQAKGMELVMTDEALDKLSNAGCSLTESSHLSLQTPYYLFGIGRTNGYIEEFYVGRTHESNNDEEEITQNNYRLFNGLIPNSQLVILPTPPETPSQWQIELFVSPSSSSFWVIIAVFGTILLLLIPIIALALREYRQDKKEKQKEHHEMVSVFI
jgi:hypothetical protein